VQHSSTLAAWAARALGAPRIDALHVRLDPVGTILPTEAVSTPEQMGAIEAAAAAQRAKENLRRIRGLPAAEHTGQWDHVVGVPADEVRRPGPDAAPVAMTLPAAHPASAKQAAPEAALFGTGRPVRAVAAFGSADPAGSWRRPARLVRNQTGADRTASLAGRRRGGHRADGGRRAATTRRWSARLVAGQATHRVRARPGGSYRAALLAAAMDAGGDGWKWAPTEAGACWRGCWAA